MRWAIRIPKVSWATKSTRPSTSPRVSAWPRRVGARRRGARVVGLLVYSRADSILGELPLNPADGIQDVLQGVEVVERPLALILGESEFRHLAEQRLSVERIFWCLVD
jgi:hypothetical protein